MCAASMLPSDDMDLGRYLVSSPDEEPGNAPARASDHWDVIVIGGGPAGLSAALMLARACRSVLVIDAGKQRNLSSRHVHGFFSRDGIPPLELLSEARGQLLKYPSARLRVDVVTKCELEPAGFAIETTTGHVATCDALLLAQGARDVLPDIKGVDRLYGTVVHHCPFCDAWEHRGKRLVVYGSTKEAAEVAYELRGWSSDVVLVTDAEHQLTSADMGKLQTAGVHVIHSRPLEIHEKSPDIHALACEGGESIPFSALFFVTHEVRPQEFLQALGCKLDAHGPVLGEDMQTSVRGVFIAGNAAPGRDMVAVAVIQGMTAAMGIQEHFLELGKFYGHDGFSHGVEQDCEELPMQGQALPIKAGGDAWLPTNDGGPGGYCRVKVLECNTDKAVVSAEDNPRHEVAMAELEPLHEYFVGDRMLPETEDETLEALEEYLAVLRTTREALENRGRHQAQRREIERVLLRNGRTVAVDENFEKPFHP